MPRAQSAPAKVTVAQPSRVETVLTVPWIAERLAMGTKSRGQQIAI